MRALVLDIDGTLIFRGRRQVSPRVEAALAALQRRGVAVVFATGRAAFASVGAVLGIDFAPDFRICVNGACIMDKDNAPVFEDRMSAEQVEALADFAAPRDYQLNFSFEDAYYTYVSYESFLEYYKGLTGMTTYIKDGTARTRHRESLPYGGYTTMPPAAMREFAALRPDIKMLESVPGSYDICKAHIDKRQGVEIVLDMLGLEWRDVVAVGDGENDIAMLRRAGVGVAMGNAPDSVKAAAEDIAPGVGEDGVYAVIQKYFSE